MLAIIDGDVLAYQACKNRYDRNKAGFTSIDGKLEKVEVTYTAEENAEYLMVCWETFQKDLQELLDKVYCTDFIMAVRGDDNFRDEMYPLYKHNRHKDPSKMNPFVPSLRQLAVYHELAVYAHGREADDLIRIWAEQARAVGQEYVICSIDKDLRCIPGVHYIMHYKEEKKGIIEVSEDTALRFYYEQMLMGDPTDHIPGVPGLGPKNAAKMIAQCATEAEMQEMVVAQYFAAYGAEGFWSHFLSNAKMIHIQKHERDYFTHKDWPILMELAV
jgi:5'-3' exonuclease